MTVATINTAPPKAAFTSLLGELAQHPDYQALQHDPCYFTTKNALGLRSPLNLPDMDKAVAYLQAAFTAKTPRGICIVGDRDVDGISSTALLASFVRPWYSGSLKIVVSDAGDDYGLSGTVFTKVLDMSLDLVILLDMGTSNGPEIAQLQRSGKQVIVLDHHQLHDRIADPQHCAFVNPHRAPQQHPILEAKIATVGLVFKLLLAFGLMHTRDWKRIYCLPLAATTTGDTQWFAYRCGLALGARKNLSDWQAYATQYFQNELAINDGECIDLSPTESAATYTFTPSEWERMRQDSDYAGKLLLARALEVRPRLYAFVQEISDLAAVGTISDMMPLIDENRTLVRIGIGQALYQNKRGQRSYRTGYAALIRAMGLTSKPLLSRDLAWSIAPALNAAGRMGNTRLALDLLLCTDVERANELARELVRLNESRKRRTKRNEEFIVRYLKQNQLKLQQNLLFCYHPELEPGVSGIIATRLCEQYHKPVVYINNDGSHARGSIRSWNGVNVLELLDTAAELFIQFGGHPEAAGFSVAYENIDSLEKRLLQGFAQMLTQNEKEAPDGTDITHASATHNGLRAPQFHLELRPNELQRSVLNQLERLEPFGAQNPQPIIRICDVKPLQPRYMRDKLHVSFALPGAPRDLKFIAWRQGAQIEAAIQADQALNLYGCLEESMFRGWREFQFRVEYIEYSAGKYVDCPSSTSFHNYDKKKNAAQF